MNKYLVILVLFFSLLLVGCGPKKGGDVPPPSGGDITNPDIPDKPSEKPQLSTSITDSITLTDSYEGKVFTTDGIGEVKMRSHIDGDTTKFRDISGVEFSLRYYGIDTPESTATIEPWGFAASKFTKEKLKAAEKIVLQRDTAEKMTGSRYLGYVWIKDAAHPNFYNLNLLLVEQAFSTNEMYDADSRYFQAFQDAEAAAMKTGERVHGVRNDPNYDYTDTVRTVTIEQIFKDFDNIKLSGQKLIVYGVITRYVSGGFYLRSLEKNEDESLKTVDGYLDVYCFTFGNTLGKKFTPGTAVKIYCRANEFHGNIQLSDIETSAFSEYKPTIVDDEKREIVYSDYNENCDPEAFMFKPISVDLDIKGDINESPSGDITVKACFKGTDKEFNLRVPATLKGIYGDYFQAGLQINARGILTKFTPNEDRPNFFFYQLQVCNEILGENDFTIIQ